MWGGISGVLSDQTDLAAALANKVNVGDDPYPQVVDHASLPSAAANTGEIYIVQTTTGVIGLRKLAGLWRSDGSSWIYLGLYGRNASEIVNVPGAGSSATDVQAAIDDIGGRSTDGWAEGSSNLYFTAARVRSTLLTGLSLASSAVISATDTVLAALGQLQAQITALTATVNGKLNSTFTKAQLDTAVTDGNVLFVGDITQYTDENARDAIGAALVAGANITITVDDAGNTITIAATGGGGGGSGDVVGPTSATDNAIVRFDATTGKQIQNSAATVDDQGAIRSATNSGANPVSVPLVNYIYQNANYTLANVATEQKIFDQTTNGTLTLPTGFYHFKAFLIVTSMSATSGNAAFDPVGAGTAVCSDFAYDSYGLDNNTQPNAVLAISGVGSVTQQSGANIVLGGTGTGMRVTIQGVFRVDTAGTIIPSLTLVTAAAAIVNAGSHFIIEKIGEVGENSVGAWT